VESDDEDEDANKPYVLPNQTQNQPFAGQDLAIQGKKTEIDPNAPNAAANTQQSSYIKRLSAEDIEKNKEIMLGRPDDLMFISPFAQGYSLRSKLWLRFYIDDCRPIDWNDEAYDHLVYPEEQKDLVLTFVHNHKKSRDASGEVVDVIKGKGQGLIFLLSGPPGTGKTLTAEAVADRSRRPLLYLQAEDLGINASVLGANLKKFMEMATEWDAVILLDEADVFLGERNPVDIARNELVSIFLREIEYYRGILFLTTNLFNTIDTAFRSRVNIHLVFQTLAPENRKVLWQKFISRLPLAIGADESTSDEKPVELVKPSTLLSDEDFTELSQWDLNGREIKNAVKTVRSWCECKGYAMTLGRLESGIRVTAPGAAKRVGGDNSLYDD
jgi:ATPase family associated with various cellular activities (AAA)